MSALAEKTTQDLISIVAWAIERTGKSPATAREIAARSIAQHDRQVEAEAVRQVAEDMFWDGDRDTPTGAEYYLLLDRAGQIESQETP